MELRAAFAFFDKDSSGNLSHDELVDVLSHTEGAHPLPREAAASNATALLRQATKSDALSLDSFLSLCRRPASLQQSIREGLFAALAALPQGHLLGKPTPSSEQKQRGRWERRTSEPLPPLKLCLVCLEEPRAVRLRPCGHAACCEWCMLALLKLEGTVRCPACREETLSLEYAADAGTPRLARQRTFDSTSLAAPLAFAAFREAVRRVHPHDERAVGTPPELHEACRNGDDSLARALLAEGAAVDGVDVAARRQPLHLACLEGHVEVAMWLHENGARLDAVDATGCQPLHYACGSAHLPVVEWLVAAGAPLNTPNASRDLPLHLLCTHGGLEAVKSLHRAGARLDVPGSDGAYPLHLAAGGGDVPLVEWLLDEQAAPLHATNSYGLTALHYACREGRLACAQLLHARGLGVDAAADFNVLPLHLAAASGRLDVCRWLAARGVRLDVPNAKGWQPLHYACHEGRPKIVEWLVAEGASLSAASLSGSTPLHFAASAGHLAVFAWLLRRGARLSDADADGNTPFHVACKRGHLALALHLHDEACLPPLDAPNRGGWAALHLAAFH